MGVAICCKPFFISFRLLSNTNVPFGFSYACKSSREATC
jgi:hypothetical protein